MGLILERIIIAYKAGFNATFLKELKESINNNEIRARISYIEDLINVFVVGMVLTSLIIVSIFLEKIINILYKQKYGKIEGGFGHKIKALGLNIVDAKSNYTLQNFYEKIRSKYIHKEVTKKLAPSNEEMQITFKLLRKFLETLK